MAESPIDNPMPCGRPVGLRLPTRKRVRQSGPTLRPRGRYGPPIKMRN